MATGHLTRRGYRQASRNKHAHQHPARPRAGHASIWWHARHPAHQVGHWPNGQAHQHPARQAGYRHELGTSPSRAGQPAPDKATRRATGSRVGKPACRHPARPLGWPHRPTATQPARPRAAETRFNWGAPGFFLAAFPHNSREHSPRNGAVHSSQDRRAMNGAASAKRGKTEGFLCMNE